MHVDFGNSSGRRELLSGRDLTITADGIDIHTARSHDRPGGEPPTDERRTQMLQDLLARADPTSPEAWEVAGRIHNPRERADAQADLAGRVAASDPERATDMARSIDPSVTDTSGERYQHLALAEIAETLPSSDARADYLAGLGDDRAAVERILDRNEEG